MSYVIQAILSNPRHPECGQITIPFPIPVDQYDQTIEMLRTMGLGDATNQDCIVDEVDSQYSVLGKLNGMLVNVDQMDYLAKRLDSFCVGEDSQFQAMAHKLEMAYIRDFINLTFCCQQATVITDFSDLEAVGRTHYLNMRGGCCAADELANLDGTETALLLIDGGGEMVTPYGVVYDNGMKLEQVYNGRQLPAYPYDSTVTDPVGIHARPAGMLAKAAKALDSTATIVKADGKSAAATKLMAIMGMGIKTGETITVTIEGGNEEANAATMEQFFKENM